MSDYFTIANIAINNLTPNELTQLQAIIEQKLHGESHTESVQVGIIADLHGDYDGFVKALDLFDQHGITHILCAGDVVDRGSDADKIVQLFIERGIICCAGNHDRTVVENQARWRASDNPERLRELGRIVSDDTIAFLEALPDTTDITIAGKRILIAHGTPWSDVLGVFPDSRQSTYERIHKDYANDYDIVVLGHTHHPLHATIGDLTILNAGSIYSITARDSHTCGILALPDALFTLYDLHTMQPIDLAITQK